MAQLMRAIKKLKYNKIGYRPGDVFEAKGRHALLLVHAQLAEIVQPKVAMMQLGPPIYKTRHMEAEQPGEVAKQPEEITKQPSEMTVLELRDEADKRGIVLPRGYIAKAELLNIIERA
jgi:hypothetical protein